VLKRAAKWRFLRGFACEWLPKKDTK